MNLASNLLACRCFRCWALAFCLLAGILGPSSSGAQDTKTCALVVIHGKWGNPQYISFFGRRMEPTCDFKSIEMPWAKRRAYDQTYDAALADIAAQVKAFRDQGHRRVLLAGHSFGANAALAYMAKIGDVDGVIALAPGHSPQSMYERGIGRDAVDKARELVAAGEGDKTLTMEDLNMGQRQTMRMKAVVLLSYFDPKGLGDMPTSAAAFKKPVPFIWVAGSADPLTSRMGPEYAFKRAPEHPASRYLEVQSDHGSTPEVAAPEVLEWIKRLP